MKKVLAVTGVFALAVFGVATYGFASEGDGPWGDTHTNVNVSNESSAYVKTDVDTKAKTGGNDANALSGSVGGSSRAKGGYIATGDADATSDVGVAVNTNDTEINLGCGCDGRDGDTWTDVNVSNLNRAKVKTYVDTKADTGHNDANAASLAVGGSSRARGGKIFTGAASAWSTVGVVANTNLTSINIP